MRPSLVQHCYVTRHITGRYIIYHTHICMPSTYSYNPPRFVPFRIMLLVSVLFVEVGLKTMFSSN